MTVYEVELLAQTVVDLTEPSKVSAPFRTQQLPPMFLPFVRLCTLPTAPDRNPPSPGFAHGAQVVLWELPPYDRQYTMPKYIPVMSVARHGWRRRRWSNDKQQGKPAGAAAVRVTTAVTQMRAD